MYAQLVYSLTVTVASIAIFIAACLLVCGLVIDFLDKPTSTTYQERRQFDQWLSQREQRKP